MKVVARLLVLCFFSIPGFVNALDIVEPVEGQTVQLGSTLRIVVKPEPGESWKGVAIGFDEVPYDSSLNAYVREFQVPSKGKFGPLKLTITALSENDDLVTLTRTITVAPPSNLSLNDIRIRDDQKKLFFFAAGDSYQLRVTGQFSDGVERDVSGGFGTTYTSSDEDVVTIDANGLVTAQRVGTAKIKVRNREFALTVEAIVEASP